ncbi:MAG TPA: M1 family metallopeptidase, partial [Polyangiaceae bacterium]
LDAAQHRVQGTETIEWRNSSEVPANELYLHAYLNAFAGPRSRFLRQAPEHRRSSSESPIPGGLIIRKLSARELGDMDLLPRLAKHSPDDPDDATDLRVDLPTAVAPGQVVTLDLEFTAVLPALVERAGFSGTFHAIAQWYPKLARRTKTGEWKHFSYDALAEFSSDFGDYDVTLDVPNGFVIAAPGHSTLVAQDATRHRERYCTSAVHDFAWFAWDRFVVTTAQFGTVNARVYASRDQAGNTRRTLESLKFGLDQFGTWLFPYPYADLTVVHPPDNARAAGGMEYPQLITTGGPWFLSDVGLHAIEALTLHELGHQWFFGAIASDEYWFPVLDEGLTSWLEAKAMQRRFGNASLIDTPFFSVSEAALRHLQARRYSRRGPLAIPAPDFGDFDGLAGRVYARFPTLLDTIGAVYGEARLATAIAGFARKYRFAHPDVSDFLEAMRMGLDHGAYMALSTSLASDGWVDFAVTNITVAPSTNGVFENRIQLERRGTLDFPIELQVQFENGHIARRHIVSVRSSQWIDWPYVSRVRVATLDPEHRIAIDDDLGNQSRRVGPPDTNSRLALLIHWILSILWSFGWP